MDPRLFPKVASQLVDWECAVVYELSTYFSLIWTVFSWLTIFQLMIVKEEAYFSLNIIFRNSLFKDFLILYNFSVDTITIRYSFS